MLAALGQGTPAGAFNIFRTLAHHPKLFKRWSAFGGVLLYRNELPAREREIVILRTGWNCQSDYEWGQHKAIGVQVGLAEDGAIGTTRPTDEGRWNEAGREPIDAADELRHESKTSDATWAKLIARYDKKQLIELVMSLGQ